MFRSYINSTSIRRSLLGAMTALALVAGSAPVSAESFIASIADYSGPTRNTDYARDYAKANQELQDGKLVGVAYSTGTFQAVPGRTPIMTPMQRRVSLDNVGSGGRGGIGSANNGAQ